MGMDPALWEYFFTLNIKSYGPCMSASARDFNKFMTVNQNYINTQTRHALSIINTVIRGGRGILLPPIVLTSPVPKYKS